MITFSPEIGFWSPFVFWFVVLTSIFCALFAIVVVIGGIGDLRYLFRELRQAEVDETDDGRVMSSDTDETGQPG